MPSVVGRIPASSLEVVALRVVPGAMRWPEADTVVVVPVVMATVVVATDVATEAPAEADKVMATVVVDIMQPTVRGVGTQRTGVRVTVQPRVKPAIIVVCTIIFPHAVVRCL